MATIAQVANFVSPTSGGIRTALARLRHGYLAAGHTVALIVPGPRDRVERTAGSTLVHLRAPTLPRSGGYRVLVNVRRVRRALERLAPDVVEVSDRFTLRGLGPWAAEAGVRSTLIVHERLDRLAPMHVPFPLRVAPAARRDNLALAARFDAVVCPSRWAAAEMAGAANVHVVGWGVDLDTFSPARRSAVLRLRLLAGSEALVVMVCRLSPEKRPHSVIDAMRVLQRRRPDVRLVIAGTGAAEASLRRRARGLPVTFLGHLHGRDHVAELLASADLAVCPGPVETFGLAALEALASGTAVVSSASGAIAELVRHPFGRSAYNHGPALAATLLEGLDDVAREPERVTRAARREAERHPWDRAVQRMLQVHQLTGGGSSLRPAAETPSPPRPTRGDAPGSER